MTNRFFKNNSFSQSLSTMKSYFLLPVLLLFLVISTSCSLSGFFKPQTAEVEYHVRAGDSLYLIARNFEVSLIELQKINRIEDPRKLRVGQIIRVPSREPEPKEAYGGPYVSAERAKRERAKVILPDLKLIKIKMSMPLINRKMGSPFGYRGSRFHEGIDLSAEEGTPIFAAHDGIVVFSGQRLSGYGKMVALKQAEILTVYAHNSINVVERGQLVKRGEKIAEVGATGRASGNHLHFEVRAKGSDGRYYAVDPLEFLK